MYPETDSIMMLVCMFESYIFKQISAKLLPKRKLLKNPE